MDRPQQQELERSGRTPVDQEARDHEGPAVMPIGEGKVGPIPPDNRPGNHPAREQDKPLWAGGAARAGLPDGNKAELYREAKRLGIRGRSRMSKKELAEAISRR